MVSFTFASMVGMLREVQKRHTEVGTDLRPLTVDANDRPGVPVWRRLVTVNGYRVRLSAAKTHRYPTHVKVVGDYFCQSLRHKECR